MMGMFAEMPSVADVERAMAEVASRPEFQVPPPPAWRLWLANMLSEMWLMLISLISLQGESDQRLLFWSILAVLALSAAWLAFRLARGGFPVRNRGVGALQSPEVHAESWSAARWEMAAREAAAAERWRDAALALYQALILSLHERDLLRFDPSKTPGDYRRETRGHAEAQARLTGFLRLFEPRVFGTRVLDAGGYGEMQQAAGFARTDG
jgi:hypothetical protein